MEKISICLLQSILSMKNKILIFDLDATLYYVGDKMEKRFDDKIVSYFIKTLDVSEEKVWDLIYELRKKYKYDSEAITQTFSVSQAEFMEYVCDVTTDDIVQDKELDILLKQISNDKYILTDSTKKHVKDVLNKMEVSEDHFIYVYDAHDMEYIYKYRDGCFEKFLEHFNLRGKDCVIFEDNIENIEKAKGCGITTVYIKPDIVEKPQCVDYLYPDIKTSLKDLFSL